MESRRDWSGVVAVTAWAVAVALVAVACGSRTDTVAPAPEAAQRIPDKAVRAPSALNPRGGLAWRDYFPNVELTTHNGDRVRFYDDLIKDKVVVINFMYANCTES